MSISAIYNQNVDVSHIDLTTTAKNNSPMLQLPHASINYYPSHHSQHSQEIPSARAIYLPSIDQEYTEFHEREVLM